ncbi:unnamed protein product [Citrullus colocynthis]|uniref:Uncharacterized protein n=1 Tax=Citrullus colocynthis TaxID=252529 RepID=A0ABP0XPV3_9ROSI
MMMMRNMVVLWLVTAALVGAQVPRVALPPPSPSRDLKGVRNLGGTKTLKSWKSSESLCGLVMQRKTTTTDLPPSGKSFKVSRGSSDMERVLGIWEMHATPIAAKRNRGLDSLTNQWHPPHNLSSNDVIKLTLSSDDLFNVKSLKLHMHNILPNNTYRNVGNMNSVETVEHMFINSSFSKTIWDRFTDLAIDDLTSTLNTVLEHLIHIKMTSKSKILWSNIIAALLMLNNTQYEFDDMILISLVNSQILMIYIDNIENVRIEIVHIVHMTSRMELVYMEE